MHLKDSRQLMENKSFSSCYPQFPEARKGWGLEKSINTCSNTLPLSICYWPWPEAGERNGGIYAR